MIFYISALAKAISYCCCCCSGADELLTILSYVIIQTQTPDLIIEGMALMDFAREKFVSHIV